MTDATAKTATMTMAKCSPHLRWVTKNVFGMEMKLQQAWDVTAYQDGKPLSINVEWRDVPTEMLP